TLSNGTQTNQWVVGTAVNNGGANSLYISNDNGLTNNYTNNSTSTVHAYKDFTIPVNTSDIVIEFDWRAEAEGGWDYLNVWLVSTAYTPTVGTEISVATDRILLFEDLSTDASFKREQLIQDITNYSGSFRIVFEWINDGIFGDNPAAAIDNIAIN